MNVYLTQHVNDQIADCEREVLVQLMLSVGNLLTAECGGA